MWKNSELLLYYTVHKNWHTLKTYLSDDANEMWHSLNFPTLKHIYSKQTVHSRYIYIYMDAVVLYWKDVKIWFAQCWHKCVTVSSEACEIIDWYTGGSGQMSNVFTTYKSKFLFSTKKSREYKPIEKHIRYCTMCSWSGMPFIFCYTLIAYAVYNKCIRT